jgi:hypothetical protein
MGVVGFRSAVAATSPNIAKAKETPETALMPLRRDT